MSLLYITSTAILFVLVILFSKTKEKINFIKFLTLFIICWFAYNTLICYLLNFINIPITLLSLSVTNFVVSIIILGKIILKKEIQKYKIKKRDIIVCFIIFIVVLTCICINFKNLTRIRYISMDAVQHYKAAREFSENTTLFDKATENTSTSKSHMPMGYVNVGILFKVFKPWVGVISLYKIYILFEAVIYFLCGIMFYYLIEDMFQKREQLIIGIVFSIVYLIGYPLNSLICGFHYLLIGILYFTTIIYTIKAIILPEKIHTIYSVIVLMLLNIGLIFSYALFCPIIYLAEFIFIIYKYKKDKKYIIIYTLFALILTGLMGCDIILYQRFKEIGSTGITLEGWIYKNDWSNIALFLPFIIYYFVKIIKKENVFDKALLIIFIIFFILLAIGKHMQICSSYYFYKNSYILWLLVLYISLKAIIYLTCKSDICKDMIRIFTITYISLLIISILFIDTYIKTEGKTNENISTIMEIFTLNFTGMKSNVNFLSKEEINAMEKLDKIIKSNWRENNLLEVIPSHTQILWAKALTGYGEIYNINVEEFIKNWNNNEYKYLIVFNERQPYEIVKRRLNLDNTQIIYQNEGATIYLRNGE